MLSPYFSSDHQGLLWIIASSSLAGPYLRVFRGRGTCLGMKSHCQIYRLIPPHTAPVEVPSCAWHGAHVRPGLGDGLSRHSLGPRARTETGSSVNLESNA